MTSDPRSNSPCSRGALASAEPVVISRHTALSHLQKSSHIEDDAEKPSAGAVGAPLDCCIGSVVRCSSGAAARRDRLARSHDGGGNRVHARPEWRYARQLRRVSDLPSPACQKVESGMPTHDGHCRDRSRVGIADRWPDGSGRRCRAVLRIGAQRASLDRELPSRPSRGRAACRAMYPRRAAAGAAIQHLSGQLGVLHPQSHRHSGFSRCGHGGAAEGLAAFCRADGRRLRSDGAAAVAALRRPFLIGESRSGRTVAAEARGSAEQSGAPWPARERGPDRIEQARSGPPRVGLRSCSIRRRAAARRYAAW